MYAFKIVPSIVFKLRRFIQIDRKLLETKKKKKKSELIIVRTEEEEEFTEECRQKPVETIIHFGNR